MASAVDSRLAYARLSAVAMASRLPTANRGSTNSYTTSWDTTPVDRVAVRDDKGRPCIAQVEVTYRRMTVRPPIGKQKRYPTLVLTLLRAREPQEPAGRPRIDWKLITDLPVDSHDDAVEKLRWYVPCAGRSRSSARS